MELRVDGAEQATVGQAKIGQLPRSQRPAQQLEVPRHVDCADVRKHGSVAVRTTLRHRARGLHQYAPLRVVVGRRIGGEPELEIIVAVETHTSTDAPRIEAHHVEVGKQLRVHVLDGSAQVADSRRARSARVDDERADAPSRVSGGPSDQCELQSRAVWALVIQWNAEHRALQPSRALRPVQLGRPRRGRLG